MPPTLAGAFRVQKTRFAGEAFPNLFMEPGAKVSAPLMEEGRKGRLYAPQELRARLSEAQLAAWGPSGTTVDEYKSGALPS